MFHVFTAVVKGRQEADSHPSLEKHNKWKKAVAEFQRIKPKEKRKS